MWNWSNLSIKTKLRLATLVTSSAALLLACAALFAFEVIHFRQMAGRDLESVAEMVSSTTSAAVVFHQVNEAEEILDALRSRPYVITAAIYLADGSLFAGYSMPGVIGQFPASPEPDGTRLTGKYLTITRPIQARQNRVGTLYLQYDFQGKSTELLRLYAVLVFFVLGASLFLAVVLSTRVHRLISEPIIALAQASKAISERKDYTARAKKFGGDELGSFIDSFNQMLDRIQEQDAALRRANDELESRVEARTRELRELQRQFELILNSAGEGIYGLDLEGRITFANATASKLLGWEVSEMLGKRDHDFLSHSAPNGQVYSAERCPICAARATASGKHLPEERLARKDGNKFQAQLVITAIHEAGKTVGAVVVFSDTTERRNLENQLRQFQKMESVGRLAAGVAHDFNNLLMVIQGHASLLDERESPDPETKEALQNILEASERAATLTHQLLAFSRKKVLQRKLLNLNGVVLGVTRLLHRLLGEHVEVRMDLSASLPTIYADVGTLEQVIVNLSVNARDAMPDGGGLLLKTYVATVDEANARRNPEARPGQFVCLAVSDTGTGMDQATLDRLFEPFFTTKESGRGTGLGLATVYGVVRQHQGWIEVRSQLGKGSSFTVYIPATLVSPEPEPEPEPVAPRTEGLMGHGNILLVEDEASLRRLTRRFLEEYGYNVIEASSGVDALRRWTQLPRPIDLLVTDMVMPGGVSGGDLARQLRKSEPKLRVLFTSGYTVEMIGPQENLQPGVNFLPKPYTRQVLAKAVHRCLQIKRRELRSPMPGL